VSAALQVRDVTKRYETGGPPVEVLRGVGFDLAPGERLAITGPSGSGKSTLLHIIGTLDTPTSGTVRVGNLEPHTLPEPELARFRNRSVGFVFQDHHLLPQYTVLENVLLPTLAHRDGDGDAADRARELVEKVGLGPRVGHRPAQLSGGERQRVAVARALISRPDLVLCDEPTGSLDGRSAETVAEILFDLHREQGNVLIVVTHSLDLAERFERRFDLRDGLCCAP
jgi:lipoprotein-releasing system ATP-binding protein